MHTWSSKLILTLLAALIQILTIYADEDSVDVARAFIENEIVPDLISQPPTEYLQVTFPGNVVVNLGNELTPTQVKSQPCVNWRAYPNCYYTLMMVDPDVESRTNPTLRAVKHWLVTNIPGSYVECGEVLDAFFGSAPQNGTGLHRYVYLTYKQPRKLEFDELRVGNTSIEGRANFNPDDFATKYSLTGPIAGNFYYAAWDLTAQETLEILGAE